MVYIFIQLVLLHCPSCSIMLIDSYIARGRNLENIRFVESRRFQIHYRSHYGIFSAFSPHFLICVMTKHTFNVFFEMSKEITKSLMTVQEGGHRYRLSGPPRYNLGNLDSTAIGWQTVACSHGMWQASLCSSEGSFQLWHDVQKLLCRSSATLSQKPDRSQHAAPSPLHSSRRMMGAISAGEATSRVAIGSNKVKPLVLSLPNLLVPAHFLGRGELKHFGILGNLFLAFQLAALRTSLCKH